MSWWYYILGVVVFCCLLLGTERLLRYPLLIYLSTLTMAELFMYGCIRALVSLLELVMVLFYTKGKRNLLRVVRKGFSLELGYGGEKDDQVTYDQWRHCAELLDQMDGKEEWKKQVECRWYDWGYIVHLTKDLARARKSGRWSLMQQALHLAMQINVGGIMNEMLYSETNTGTKETVEKYVAELEATLRTLPTFFQSGAVSKKEFLEFCLGLKAAYGHSALCLSGGGGLGNYHLGVVESLLNEGLLPHIISGASAGACIASHICVRTDEELKESLKPELIQPNMGWDYGMTNFQKLKNFLRRGYVFNPVRWETMLKWHTLGDTTFIEAFNKTGRILNVSTTSSHLYTPSILLNYITAPHVVIWSALIASSSLPGLLPPAPLLQKTPDGELVPYLGSDLQRKTRLPPSPVPPSPLPSGSTPLSAAVDADPMVLPPASQKAQQQQKQQTSGGKNNNKNKKQSYGATLRVDSVGVNNSKNSGGGGEGGGGGGSLAQSLSLPDLKGASKHTNIINKNNNNNKGKRKGNGSGHGNGNNNGGGGGGGSGSGGGNGNGKGIGEERGVEGEAQNLQQQAHKQRRMSTQHEVEDEWTAQSYRDGSFKNDLPMKEIAHTFNTSFFLVSQVNPHIAPFFFYNRGNAGSGGSGWRRNTGGWRGGYFLSCLEAALKHDMKKNLALMAELHMLPNVWGADWSYVFLQDFMGHVALVPRLRLWDYYKIISSPSIQEMRHYFSQGKLMVWRKLTMIRSRVGPGAALNDVILAVTKAIKEEEALQVQASPRSQLLSSNI